MKLPYLFKRNNKYQFRRAIPEALRPYFGGNREFKRSLKTSDKSIAVSEYAVVHQECEQRFAYAREVVRSGKAPTTQLSREDALALRAQLGLPAGQAFDPANQTDEEALRQLWLLAQAKNLQQNPGPLIIDAVLGDTHLKIRLSEAPAEYFKATAYEETGLNSREKDKKHKPVELAFKELLEVVGDTPIFSLAKEDAKRFREVLKGEIEFGSIKADTANKKLGHISKVLTRLANEQDIDFDNPFKGRRFAESGGKRQSFEHSELEAIFAEGQLDGLNPECRGLLMAKADTGSIFKELCQLDPDRDINLKAEIPHIRIRANDFGGLKTSHRERRIPLVGLALEAFQEFPNGFEKYRKDGGPEAASANAMKYLKRRRLLPTPDHKLYSLRHSFKDRLREANVPQEVQDRLMGHKSHGMGAHYGTSDKIERLHEYMNRIKPIQCKNKNK